MCEGFSLEDVLALDEAHIAEYGFMVVGVNGGEDDERGTTWPSAARCTPMRSKRCRSCYHRIASARSTVSRKRYLRTPRRGLVVGNRFAIARLDDRRDDGLHERGAGRGHRPGQLVIELV